MAGPRAAKLEAGLDLLLGAVPENGIRQPSLPTTGRQPSLPCGNSGCQHLSRTLLPPGQAQPSLPSPAEVRYGPLPVWFSCLECPRLLSAGPSTVSPPLGVPTKAVCPSMSFLFCSPGHTFCVSGAAQVPGISWLGQTPRVGPQFTRASGWPVTGAGDGQPQGGPQGPRVQRCP